MPFVQSIDMYRKVPADLMEGTMRGSFFSVCAVVAMVTLFVMETWAFFQTSIVTDMHIDRSDDPKVRVNFNITMMDLACEYAVVDVVSVLGTEQNVTQHVNKWKIDAAGVRGRYHGRNKHQKDILYHDEAVTAPLHELHEDGEDAVALDENTLQFAKNENTFLFVDYYAGWCSHCQVLAPTWETLAELMREVAAESVEEKLRDEYPDGEHGYTETDYHRAVLLSLPVTIGKVDCVAHREFCMKQGIVAYPTLRLFVKGEKFGDYRGDRTILSFTNYLSTVEEDRIKKDPELKASVSRVDEIAGEYMGKEGAPRKVRIMRPEWKDEDHPGCQISGFLLLDRVPGNFHIKARSNSHDLVPSMTNVSHEIHSLTFGDPGIIRTIEKRKVELRAPHNIHDKLIPLNGNVYVTNDEHTAYHHHLKVVTTSFTYKGYPQDRVRPAKAYQVLAQSQLSHYDESDVPEAKFIYDLSPVAVSFRQKKRMWYDYVTSIMAIVGGVFTVVGMMESSVYAIASKKKMM